MTFIDPSTTYRSNTHLYEVKPLAIRLDGVFKSLERQSLLPIALCLVSLATSCLQQLRRLGYVELAVKEALERLQSVAKSI
jgi:hypothetical protein